MVRGTSTLLTLLVLAPVSVRSQQASFAQQAIESHVVPLKKFSPDHRFETVSGDPAISGAPFVIRIHAEAGYGIIPHTHPIDENIVGRKGSWALALGEALQPASPRTHGGGHLWRRTPGNTC